MKHLMFDMRECDYEKMNSQEYIYKILNELPELINMTKIIPPYVFPYCGVNPKDKGLTGIVIIAESHMSIHTFTEKNYVFFDLFSCRPFDEEKAKSYIIKAFGSKYYDIFECERGKFYSSTN